MPAGGSPAQARHGIDTGLETGQYTAAEVGPRIWVSSGPTGGLVYAHLAIDILDVSDFDPARLGDIGLLREILPESGHGGFGPDETRARLARICDHLEVEPRILARAAPGSDASGAWAPRVVLLMSARAQAADEAALVEVLADTHLDVRFDASAQTAVGTPWPAAHEAYGCDQPYNTYLALYRVEGEAAVKALGPIPYPDLAEDRSRSQRSHVSCFMAHPPG